MAEYIRYSYPQLKKFCEDAFAKLGFCKEDCEIITDVLLLSDLYGIESHGMILASGEETIRVVFLAEDTPLGERIR